MDKTKLAMTVWMMLLPWSIGDITTWSSLFSEDWNQQKITTEIKIKDTFKKPWLQESVSIDTIDIDQAIQLVQAQPEHQKKLQIFYVADAAQPFDYDYPKEYIFIHGGANATDEELIHLWYTKANFAYAILKNWKVIQFFDESIWAGWIGAFWAVNWDALSGVKGIAIEFSAKYQEKKKDVEEPNEYQLHSAMLLLKYLKEKYKIKKISTHRQAVQDVPYPYSIYTHVDANSRSDDILKTLWISRDTFSWEYKKEDIEKRLQIAKKLADSLWTIDSIYIQKSNEYRNNKKNDTVFNKKKLL